MNALLFGHGHIMYIKCYPEHSMNEFLVPGADPENTHFHLDIMREPDFIHF